MTNTLRLNVTQVARLKLWRRIKLKN